MSRDVSRRSTTQGPRERLSLASTDRRAGGRVSAGPGLTRGCSPRRRLRFRGSRPDAARHRARANGPAHTRTGLLPEVPPGGRAPGAAAAGPKWTQRGRPPAGYFTDRTADEALQESLRTRVAARSPAPSPALARRSPTRAPSTSVTAVTTSSSRRRRSPTTGTSVAHSSRSSARRPRSRSSRPRGSTATASGSSRKAEWSRRTVQKVLVILYGILKRAKRRSGSQRTRQRTSSGSRCAGPATSTSWNPRGRRSRERRTNRDARRDLYRRGVHRAPPRRAAGSPLARRRL